MNAQPRFQLRVEDGYAGWRRLALHALAEGWPPDALHWVEPDAAAADVLSLPLGAGSVTLDAVQAATQADAARPLPDVRVSKALASLLADAALFRSPQRWAFLYRVLWRWHQGDRCAAQAADADGARLHAMAKAVHRARHDMEAYVRFQRCEADGHGSPQYVAWYAPEHDVLALAAAHFARRMGRTPWLIITPQGAAQWDGAALHHTRTPPDADDLRLRAADDGIESLWLRYYQSIFNPARLNETALRQRMPARFWKHLPEAALIPSLIVQARTGMARTGQASAVRDMPGKTIAPAAVGVQTSKR